MLKKHQKQDLEYSKSLLQKVIDADSVGNMTLVADKNKGTTEGSGSLKAKVHDGQLNGEGTLSNSSLQKMVE